MNLSRSRSGTMIHTRACRFTADSVEWRWAVGKSMAEVIRVCEAFGYQTCQVCKPLPGTVIRQMPKGTET